MDSTALWIALIVIAVACPISMWLMMRGHKRERDSLRDGGHSDGRPPGTRERRDAS